MNKVICIDIGNKNIKIGKFKNLKEKPEVFIDRKENSSKIIEKLKNKYENSKIYGISVVPFIKERLMEKFKIKFFENNDFKEIKNPYIDKEKLGIDRIVNIYAAINLFKKDVIVIDFGTAITIDVAFKNGDFKGGLIIPSPKTQLEVLSKKTALIKMDEIHKGLKIIGKSTEECVSFGIKNVTVFGIKGIIDMIKRKYRKNFKIIITGGDAFIYKKYLKNTLQFPYLTLYGVYIKSLRYENNHKLSS
ncbi:MAG: type III pantothenate kinase [candidate division WOR-3 bacterium]